MTIIVAGSRTFADKDFLFATLDKLTRKLNKSKLLVLVGDATGADKLASGWCFKRMVRYQVFRADWNKHGKSAGPRRNREMLDAGGQALIAFRCEGISKGTDDIVTQAKKRGIKIILIRKG